MPAYHHATLSDFLADDPDRLVGVLARRSAENGFLDLKQKQTLAWKREIEALRAAGQELRQKLPYSAKWVVLLEYPIPRRQKRIDVVMIADDLIFCLEFKTEDKDHSAAARQQVEDYALDLRDFHEESSGRRIVPVAVSLRAGRDSPSGAKDDGGLVRAVRTANGVALAECIRSAYEAETRADKPIDSIRWNLSAYRPVPTIIEAAEALYAGHDVAEIAHSHAGAINLSQTSERVVSIVREAQVRGHKVLCIITGVPGAGKTLAGLNIIHNPTLRDGGRPPGVFLSGNGPLVKVISAAISRDFRRRGNHSDGDRTVGTFIQNVHTFVREGLEKPDRPPIERLVVFDEAQRAWNAEHHAKKTGSVLSEPEIMLSIMDRHSDWAVVVALVGGGQEINSGEAGLSEWGRSIRSRFSHWHVCVSPGALTGDASVAGHQLFENGRPHDLVVSEEPMLHLDVCVRSFRAQRLAEWVNAVVGGCADEARALLPLPSEFPLVLTRDLSSAREWLKGHARGLRRCGLVASSGAIRLRADGLELSSGFRQGNRDLYVNWFLNLPPDIRSSNQLEVVASEYECQGLELDWVGVCWGGDLVRDAGDAAWRMRHFSGDRWLDSKKPIDRQYLLNTYRVLLTRAREGTIIWIPRGDEADPTRAPAEFDAVVNFFKRCGVPEI